ncbi:MAG TPA: DUF2142 domain-containing protein, partial [Acidimicrobiales bacterium]|nr:DUF2142 domain-containing protein [Acidimicrobiales bacterium]
PLYYLLVGWPTLLMSTPSSLYAMRIISAILNGAMLAVAYLAAGLRLFPLRNSAILRKFTRHKFTTPVRVQVPSTQRNNYLSLGVTIAMTPVVLFNGSIINPNGLEATGAIALWSCLAAMFCNSPGSEQSLLIPLGTVSACITASMRGLSPFWVVVICLIAAIYAGKESISRIFQHRLSKICLATIFAALSLASIWIIWAGSLDLAGYPCGNKCPSLPRAISISAGKTWTDLHQLVNVFGWINLSTNKLTTDTTAPQATYLIWCAVMIGVLLAVAYATLPHRKFSILRNDTSNVFRSSKPSSRTIPIESDTRQRNFQKSRGIALGILVLAVIVMPVILEVSQSRNIGFIWQGRYILPIAVGIPILASGMLRPGHMMVQFVRFCGLILLIGQVIAFYGILHRYSVGANGSWWIFGHVAWSPPLPICLLIALLALSMSSVYWSMLKSIAPTPETISITTSPRPQKID